MDEIRSTGAWSQSKRDKRASQTVCDFHRGSTDRYHGALVHSREGESPLDHRAGLSQLEDFDKLLVIRAVGLRETLQWAPVSSRLDDVWRVDLVSC